MRWCNCEICFFEVLWHSKLVLAGGTVGANRTRTISTLNVTHVPHFITFFHFEQNICFHLILQSAPLCTCFPAQDTLNLLALMHCHAHFQYQPVLWHTMHCHHTKLSKAPQGCEFSLDWIAFPSSISYWFQHNCLFLIPVLEDYFHACKTKPKFLFSFHKLLQDAPQSVGISLRVRHLQVLCLFLENHCTFLLISLPLDSSITRVALHLQPKYLLQLMLVVSQEKGKECDMMIWWLWNCLTKKLILEIDIPICWFLSLGP